LTFPKMGGVSGKKIHLRVGEWCGFYGCPRRFAILPYCVTSSRLPRPIAGIRFLFAKSRSSATKNSTLSEAALVNQSLSRDHEAENGREAIEKAQQLHPDLIVLDLSMRVMNGIEAARVLQGLMPTVPLIVFSEYSDVFSEKEARSAGVSALSLKV